MKQTFRNTNFRGDSLTRIEQMNEIIEEYQAQNLRMTARQLYYQLVSRDLIANQPAEYKKLTSLLTDARYAGMIDWDAIEDRGREPVIPSQWDSIGDLVDSALRSYRLPRWKGQKNYAELWVEKQALAGVLEPLARSFHVPLMVNKGYSSASAMKESATRIKDASGMEDDLLDDYSEKLVRAKDEYGEDSDEHKEVQDELRSKVRIVTVFYLGDHDPSGEDMVRDIKDRLSEFRCPCTVEKIALTTAQIRQYNPPPNPAKITDPRAKKYIAKHGDSSWEVDALPPNVLAQLVRTAFRRVVDQSTLDKILKQEELDKKRLRKAVESIED